MKRFMSVLCIVFLAITVFACKPKAPAGSTALTSAQMRLAAYYVSSEESEASRVSGVKRAVVDLDSTMEEIMIIGRSLQKTFDIDQVKLEQLTKLQAERSQKITELGLFYNDLAIYKVDANAAQKKSEADYSQLMRDYETLNPRPALAGGKDIVNSDIKASPNRGWKYHYDEIARPYKSKSSLLQEADALSEEYVPGLDVKAVAAESDRPRTRFDSDEAFEARVDKGRKANVSEEDIEMYAEDDVDDGPPPKFAPATRTQAAPKAAAPTKKAVSKPVVSKSTQVSAPVIKNTVRVLSGFYSAETMARSLRNQGENVISHAPGQKVDVTQIIYRPSAAAYAKTFQSKYFRGKSKLIPGQASQGTDLVLILGANLNK